MILVDTEELENTLSNRFSHINFKVESLGGPFLNLTMMADDTIDVQEGKRDTISRRFDTSNKNKDKIINDIKEIVESWISTSDLPSVGIDEGIELGEEEGEDGEKEKTKEKETKEKKDTVKVDDKNIPVKSVNEIRQEIKQTAQQEVKEDVEVKDASSGRKWLQSMLNKEGKVVKNSLSTPTVEIIATQDMVDEIRNIVEKYKMEPVGEAIPFFPSFEDELPDNVVNDLRSWQFILQDDENKDLLSTGYNVPEILKEVQSMNVLITVSPAVQTDLPI